MDNRIDFGPISIFFTDAVAVCPRPAAFPVASSGYSDEGVHVFVMEGDRHGHRCLCIRCKGCGEAIFPREGEFLVPHACLSLSELECV